MATIYDIAKKVGCAPSSVSKYLTHHGYVSEQLGAKIAAAIQEMDYHYNGLARELSCSTNNRIGIMVPFLDHPYFQSLITTISEAAASYGKELVIMPTNYDPLRERFYLEKLVHRLVGSIIVSSHSLPYQEINQYQKYGNVVFCEDIADKEVNAVQTNRFQTLVSLFKQLRHDYLTHIGLLLVRPSNDSRTTKETLEAYKHVFGLLPAVNQVVYDCRSYQDGQRGFKQLIAQFSHLDAILTESDDTAAGAFQVADRRHTSIKIIGQGNKILSKVLGFTSIDQHINDLGQAAIKKALNPTNIPSTMINFEIIWR